MRTSLGIILLIWAVIVMARAESSTINGYLVDKQCSKGLATQGKKAVAEHDRTCILMDVCVQSGFGVLTEDGTFIEFDEAGSKKAAEALESSAKEKDFKVTVTGDRRGDRIKVESLKLQ